MANRLDLLNAISGNPLKSLTSSPWGHGGGALDVAQLAKQLAGTADPVSMLNTPLQQGLGVLQGAMGQMHPGGAQPGHDLPGVSELMGGGAPDLKQFLPTAAGAKAYGGGRPHPNQGKTGSGMAGYAKRDALQQAISNMGIGR